MGGWGVGGDIESKRTKEYVIICKSVEVTYT